MLSLSIFTPRVPRSITSDCPVNTKNANICDLSFSYSFILRDFQDDSSQKELPLPPSLKPNELENVVAFAIEEGLVMGKDEVSNHRFIPRAVGNPDFKIRFSYDSSSSPCSLLLFLYIEWQF